MTSHVKLVLSLLALVAIPLALWRGGETAAPTGAASRHSEAMMLSSHATGELTYGSSVSAADRDLIERALAEARPEARAMIARIAPRTTIEIGAAGVGVAGVTSWRDDGRFLVRLDLGPVYQALGQRGVNRLVLHELGHVIDFALTPPALDASLDAGIPAGYGCDGGVGGACAERRERFAESYSKWATGDIGVQAGAVLGYRVPPPSNIEAWGSQLVAGVSSPR